MFGGEFFMSETEEQLSRAPNQQVGHTATEQTAQHEFTGNSWQLLPKKLSQLGVIT